MVLISMVSICALPVITKSKSANTSMFLIAVTRNLFFDDMGIFCSINQSEFKSSFVSGGCMKTGNVYVVTDAKCVTAVFDPDCCNACIGFGSKTISPHETGEYSITVIFVMLQRIFKVH